LNKKKPNILISESYIFESNNNQICL